ncbi:MAG: hypothetical protein E7366_05765 [Clostridiales bacterium]|nr:hypothetical protein [Clostridiales bacterium]
MKIGIKVESTEKPERFAFNALPDGTTEISVNEDIQVITKATPIPDSEEVATEELFESRSYFGRGQFADSDSLTEALIALKYSTGAEISLGRKGIANSEDEEYVAYITYVNDCKAAAKSYFGG